MRRLADIRLEAVPAPFERVRELSERLDALCGIWISPWVQRLATPTVTRAVERLHRMRTTRQISCERALPALTALPALKEVPEAAGFADADRAKVLMRFSAATTSALRTPRRGAGGTPRRATTPPLAAALAAAALLLAVVAAPARAEPDEGRDVVERVEKLLWGNTVRGDYEMTIATPRWQRTLGLKVWMERPKRSFVRIVSPAKEAGIGSLRIGGEMWNFLPNVERIIKIPPSMMLQPWMGSDFTNDDLVKESSALDDYMHRIVGTVQLEGADVLQIEALPKADAPVVWGRIVYWVRRADTMPLKQEYFNERGDLVRTLSFTDVKPLGGRVLPTRWEMRPVAKPGNSTAVLLKQAVFNQPIDPEVFSQRNLQQR